MYCIKKTRSEKSGVTVDYVSRFSGRGCFFEEIISIYLYSPKKDQSYVKNNSDCVSPFN